MATRVTRWGLLREVQRIPFRHGKYLVKPCSSSKLHDGSHNDMYLKHQEPCLLSLFRFHRSILLPENIPQSNLPVPIHQPTPQPRLIRCTGALGIRYQLQALPGLAFKHRGGCKSVLRLITETPVVKVGCRCQL